MFPVLSNVILSSSKSKESTIDARVEDIAKLGFDGTWDITYNFLINSSSLFDN